MMHREDHHVNQALEELAVVHGAYAGNQSQHRGGHRVRAARRRRDKRLLQVLPGHRSRARTESVLRPHCARRPRRAPCRSSGNRRLHLRRYDLRSPYCAPFPYLLLRSRDLQRQVFAAGVGAAGMRGPVLKREGSFKIIAVESCECRVPRLLRRVHAGTSILALGALF